MRLPVLVAVLLIGLSAGRAGAMMPESMWDNTLDLINVAKMQAASNLIRDEKYPGAIKLLLQVVRSEPDNADGWTLLAYSLRKSGDLAGAHEGYDKALALNPNHVYARQYLGELLLLEGDLSGAVEQLAVITARCYGTCPPLDELTARIEEYKANQAAQPAG